MRIGNPEESGFSPARPPAIFDDETLVDVVIADDQYRVVPRQISGSVGIHSAPVIKEIVIDRHRRRQRTEGGKGAFQVVGGWRSGGHIGPVLDFIGGSLPVGAGVAAASIGCNVGVAALRGQARVLEKIRGPGNRTPSAAACPAARNHELLGEVQIHVGGIARDQDGRFQAGRGREGPATAASPLVPDARDKPVGPPIEGRRQGLRLIGRLKHWFNPGEHGKVQRGPFFPFLMGQNGNGCLLGFPFGSLCLDGMTNLVEFTGPSKIAGEEDRQKHDFENQKNLSFFHLLFLSCPVYFGV